MSELKYVIGDKFGRWTIIEILKDRKVVVKCDCGNVRVHSKYVLSAKRSTSCGCFRKEAQSQRRKDNAIHNLSNHPLYGIWRGIKRRCYLKSDPSYKNYGGRGIIMCKEWLDSFKPFYDWSILNGWMIGLEIDREDNDGNYHPYNCRYVPPKVNMRNTRRNRNLTFNGVTKCITDWAIDLGVTPKCLDGRLKRWSVEKTLTTPKIVYK